MSELKNEAEVKEAENKENYSLNDDRRVKSLSPGALVAKRFFRNRLAVTGLTILVAMFLFSFLGGVISPYSQGQFFYRNDIMKKDYAAVSENKDFRHLAATDAYSGVVQAQAILAINKKTDKFTYRDTNYVLTEEGKDFYSVSLEDGTMIGIAYKDVISAVNEGEKFSFEFSYAALKAYANDLTSFEADGASYTMDENGGINKGTEEYAYVSRYIVQTIASDIFLSREFKEMITEAIAADQEVVEVTEGEATVEYFISYDAPRKIWQIKQETSTHVYDTYSAPSKAHWLGTDKNGMDMLTRLMYGGRVSLIIGFIVVIIETVLGVVMGGIAGYFGKWVDNLIMRLVDIFYCIPSMPLIIILGAAMDQMRVDPWVRMIYLMLILGFLGWAGIARLVRGQILSLREQEFMTATEACGISIPRRIFKHLIPNVIPQLIVTCTMGLGSVILTEATLSFLGLGVKFPFASWGNIINDVNNTFVLTTYWFIWIPAGVCLLLTVLAFNLVGDGLRDAFDPKMKR